MTIPGKIPASAVRGCQLWKLHHHVQPPHFWGRHHAPLFAAWLALCARLCFLVIICAMVMACALPVAIYSARSVLLFWWSFRLHLLMLASSPTCSPCSGSSARQQPHLHVLQLHAFLHQLALFSFLLVRYKLALFVQGWSFVRVRACSWLYTQKRQDSFEWVFYMGLSISPY